MKKIQFKYSQRVKDVTSVFTFNGFDAFRVDNKNVIVLITVKKTTKTALKLHEETRRKRCEGILVGTIVRNGEKYK